MQYNLLRIALVTVATEKLIEGSTVNIIHGAQLSRLGKVTPPLQTRQLLHVVFLAKSLG